MTKEKLEQLSKYADSIKHKLSDKTLPEKQKNRPTEYKQFLERELSSVNAQIEEAKVSGVSAKK
jgi:hypothetical protein